MKLLFILAIAWVIGFLLNRALLFDMLAGVFNPETPTRLLSSGAEDWLANLGLTSPARRISAFAILVVGIGLPILAYLLLLKRSREPARFKRRSYIFIMAAGLPVVFAFNMTGTRTFRFFRKPDNKMVSLHRTEKYDNRFTAFLQKRPLLAGKTVICGPPDVLDARFVILSRMKEEVRDAAFTCSPGAIDKLVKEHETCILPGEDDLPPATNYGAGGKRTILIMPADIDRVDRFVLVSTGRDYYMIPHYLYQEACR